MGVGMAPVLLWVAAPVTQEHLHQTPCYHILPQTLNGSFMYNAASGVNK